MSAEAPLYLRHVCLECGAQPGEPCKDTGDPGSVHVSRYNMYWHDHFKAALLQKDSAK